jgi:hypothetical protein
VRGECEDMSNGNTVMFGNKNLEKYVNVKLVFQ